MTALTRIITICAIGAALSLTGCGKKDPPPVKAIPGGGATTAASTDGADAGHTHGKEILLGKIAVGDLEVKCWQGHGLTEPGKEMHLVVKLPYNDNGATTVRAWIGTEDRLASMVGKADYAPSHNDFDIHVMAPDPLPENAKWWVEVEKPDGTRQVGSVALR